MKQVDLHPLAEEGVSQFLHCGTTTEKMHSRVATHLEAGGNSTQERPLKMVFISDRV